MPWFRRSPVPGSPRWRFVGALLLLTLVASAVLAWEAWRAARSHREAATTALEDHAAFVAWQFADRAQSKLDHYVISKGLWYVVDYWGLSATSAGGGAEADGAEGAAAWERPPFLRYSFALDLGSGALSFCDDGEPPAPAVALWMADTLAAHARDVYGERWSHATVAGAPTGESRLWIYTLERGPDSMPARLVGFEVEPSGLPEVFEYGFKYPLLPPSLTKGKANRDVMSIQVIGPAGDPLYRTEPAYPSDFSAREATSVQFGALPVEVALRPDIAGELLIGGLPRSRLPWLLGLLGLTGLLVAGAIVVLRRESEVARLRTEFVSNVSHELRTPLAQIRMFAETLMLGRVRTEEEERRALEIVDQEARRLTTLVENILLFSRTERGAMRLDPRPTRLRELLREIAESFGPLADARDSAIDTALGEDVTARVDPGAIRQVVLNFLDNAVKYGPEGQTVTLGLEREDGVYRVWVDDQGPGVPAPDRAEVWQAFARLEGCEEATAGTGIGLSVVRELVRRHGGRTWVEDAPEGGARFVAELPVDPDRIEGAIGETGGKGPERDRGAGKGEGGLRARPAARSSSAGAVP